MSNKNEGSKDDEDDYDEAVFSEDTAKDEETMFNENSSVESLLRELCSQRSIVSQKDDLINSLKEDLVREKKLNDTLLDHIIMLKSLPANNKRLDLSDSSDDDDDKDSGSPNNKLSQTLLSQPITPGQRPNTDNRLSLEESSEDDAEGDDDQEPIDAPKDPTDKEGESDKAAPDNDSDNQDTSNKLASLHISDIRRSKKLSYILNSLKNQPCNKTTLIIGDSNYHHIYGELDPEGKSVAVRSASGLCVVAAAYALKRYEYCYTHIKKVVWSLGANDYLHKDQHCPGDWSSHLSTLLSESERIFKGAKIHFILPFRGLPEVSSDFCVHVDKEIKKFPHIKRHFPPSFEGKVKSDGVHLTPEGSKSLRQFLVRTFTGYRPRNRPVENQPRRDNNSRAPQGRRSEVTSRGFNRGSHPVSGSRQTSQPPHINPSHGGSAYGTTNWDAGFPPLPRSGLQQRGPAQRIPYHQDNPMRDITEALAPLASILYAQLSRRMD